MLDMFKRFFAWLGLVPSFVSELAMNRVKGPALEGRDTPTPFSIDTNPPNRNRSTHRAIPFPNREGTNSTRFCPVFLNRAHAVQVQMSRADWYPVGAFFGEPGRIVQTETQIL
jgi:hypothetical protein